jgi:hypothetical protein
VAAMTYFTKGNSTKNFFVYSYLLSLYSMRGVIIAMGMTSAATRVAYSPSSRTESDGDLISHLVPAEAWDTVIRFRFVPFSYLTNCKVEWDPGIDRLLYVLSFLDEEED